MLNSILISKERLFEQYSLDIVLWIKKYSKNFIGIYDSLQQYIRQMDEKNLPNTFFVELGHSDAADIQITQLIQKQFPRSDIIILSDQKDYAYDAFQHNIKDYLLYPIHLSRYEKTALKLINKQNTEKEIEKYDTAQMRPL